MARVHAELRMSKHICCANEVQVGDRNTVTLPNGKEISFQRVE